MHFLNFFKYFIYLFSERERNINVWLPLMRPLLGTWPATQACALSGKQTSDPLVLRPLHRATPARAQFTFKCFSKDMCMHICT